MKTFLKTTLVAALILAPVAAVAASDKAVGQLDNNWGDLTSHAAKEDGRAQGHHASDPSNDGRGKEDRSGLANVVEKGNMAATTSFIDDAVNN